MAEAIRYFMDQHFPGPVTEGLRHRGIDVLTAQEADRCGLPDSDQLAFAASEERVMVTFDSDFLVLDRTGTAHAGIAWCPQDKHGFGMLVQMLELLHAVADRGIMQRRVEYL